MYVCERESETDSKVADVTRLDIFHVSKEMPEDEKILDLHKCYFSQFSFFNFNY